MSDLYMMGILRNGSYEVSRVVGSGLTEGTVMNASGMIGFGYQKSWGFVAGNLSLLDFVRYGWRI